MSDQNNSGKRRHGPVLLDPDELGLAEAVSPAEAPDPEMPEEEAAQAALATATARRRIGIGAIFWGGLASLVGLAITVTLFEFIAGLLERYPWLGWLGIALVAAVALALSAFALRELAALSRLRRIESLRETAMSGEAQATVDGLLKLYAGRPDMERYRADLAEARREITDTDDLMRFAEQRAIRPLDLAAQKTVSRGAREVAAATALIPLALIDVLAVLLANLRMIRKVAEIYGGRTGWLGSWRLLRAVAVHLMATGVVAAGDDIVGPLLGGSVLSKLSRRFGEASVNALLTARVGVAAIEICRPMPFVAETRPRATSLALDTLKLWQDRAAKDAARPDQ